MSTENTSPVLEEHIEISRTPSELYRTGVMAVNGNFRLLWGRGVIQLGGAVHCCW